MQSKVLVTGAGGFVGTHLCRSLAEEGYQVLALSSGPIPELPPGGCKWLKVGRFTGATDWSRILPDDVTHVIHLAAIAHRLEPKNQVPPASYDLINHQVTANLARAVARSPAVQRFVFISSIGAITSQADEPVSEATPCHPDSAYGQSKLAAEGAIVKNLAGHAVEWCILRPPLVYGPGNPGNMARLLRLLKWRLPLPLGSIRNRRSFLFVGNLVDAIRVAMEHPGAARATFCVSDGVDLSTSDLLRLLGQAAGSKPRLFSFPVSGLRLASRLCQRLAQMTGWRLLTTPETIDKLCVSLPVDGSLFRRTCGWSPPFSVEAGLSATVKGISILR